MRQLMKPRIGIKKPISKKVNAIKTRPIKKIVFNVTAWQKEHGMTVKQIKIAETIHNTSGMEAMQKYMKSLGKNYPGVY